MEVYSSFLNPEGLLIQFGQKDYENYFGKEVYNKCERRDEIELKELYKNFGEIDIFSNIKLTKNNINICNIYIILMSGSSNSANRVSTGFPPKVFNSPPVSNLWNIKQIFSTEKNI